MIQFIRDDFTENDKLKLNRVLNTVNFKSSKYEAKAVFLRNFVDSLVIAAGKVKKAPDHKVMTKEELEKRRQEVMNRLTELKTKVELEIKDKVMALTKLKDVREVICDGPGINLKLTHKDGHIEDSEIKFETLKELNEFILYLSDLAKVHIDENKPFINTLVDDKFHIQATYGSEFFKPKFVIHTFF